MAIDFPRSTYTAAEGVSAESWPASPSNGDTETNGAGDNFTFNGTSSLWVLDTGRTLTLSGGATYSWDGEKWIAQSHIPFRYFGPQDTDPTGLTADNEGDLYFNTVENEMRVYNGSSWDTITSVGNFNILTLSASSTAAPVGGTATFNGTATRFQLSETPNVAQQLLISINGVVQEPQAGTSPGAGFAVDGNDIIFASAPATGSTFFGVQMGATVNIGTPTNGSVTNVHVNASAAIAGSKISPNFGSQDIVTTGHIQAGGGNGPNEGFQLPDDGGTARPRITNDGDNATVIRGGSASGGVKFNNFANTTEQIRIDSSGRLLIGRSSSLGVSGFESHIQVAGTAANSSSIMAGRFSADASAPFFILHKSRGTSVTTNTVLEEDDIVGRLAWYGADGTDWEEAAHIQCQVDGEVATGGDTTDMPGRLVFATTPNGDHNALERMRIDSSGRVGIGVTPASWGTIYKVLQAGAASLVGQAAGDGSTSNYSNNAYFDITNNRWEYIGNDDASQITQSDGKIIFKRATSGTANSALTWSESMRIDSSGRLLIGLSSAPAGSSGNLAKLIVQGYVGSGGNTGVGIISLQRAEGETNVAADDELGRVTFADDTGDHFAFISGVCDGPTSASSAANDNPGRIEFWTSPDGSGAITERMRITSDGTLQLRSSPGIDFSQLQTNTAGMMSETLDSYEEGTWTPVITANTTNPTYTLVGNWSYYIKIGRLVHFNVDVQISTTNVGVGDVYISIPFATDHTSSTRMENYVGGMGGRSQTYFNLSRQEIGWYYANSQMYMYRQNRDTYGEAAALTVSYIRTGNNRLTLQGFYYSAS